jgi:hypothetical protein
MIRLSKTTKMPGASWSLPAGNTCPGSYDAEGKIIDVCAACYAKTGNYTYPNVRGVREHNRSDWKRAEWVSDMVALLEPHRYFRWFDSGDVYHPALAFKILLVIQQTPWVSHWLPTRSHTVQRIAPILDRIDALPNAVVRRSSPHIDGSYSAEHGSTVIPTADWPTSARVCPSSVQDGKCGDCRACWSKDVAVVAYVGHGLVMSQRKRRMLKQKTLDAVAA